MQMLYDGKSLETQFMGAQKNADTKAEKRGKFFTKWRNAAENLYPSAPFSGNC